jgi:hypothetical protein
MWMQHVNALERSAPQVLHMLSHCPTQNPFRLVSFFHITPIFPTHQLRKSSEVIAFSIVAVPCIVFCEFQSPGRVQNPICVSGKAPAGTRHEKYSYLLV